MGVSQSHVDIASVHSDGYVPQDQWPAVTAMLEGFGQPTLPQSYALAGETLVITFDNAPTISYVFKHDTLSWAPTCVEDNKTHGPYPYRAVEARDNIFYVEFIEGKDTSSRAHTLIINRDSGRVTRADSYFVDRSGEVRMKTDLLSGMIEGKGTVQPLVISDELAGKRIFYRYSDSDHYEHIYLTSEMFVWNCVRGAEEGLADVDPIRVFELTDGAVLLYWSETVMPVESFVIIDLTNERSIGRMFCWDGPTLAPMHLPFDSQFTVLNETKHPER